MKFIKANIPFFQTFLVVVILFGITTMLYLYTAGFRLNRNLPDQPIDLKKTGMVSAKSMPEGASVYIDEELRTATNDTVPGINPGFYKLTIKKKGFVDWEKEIEIFPELVTDITAILVSQTPRLEPLTNTGALQPTISTTNTKLAYFSKDSENPGIWIIPLGQGALNLFRTTPYIVIKDTPFIKYSEGKQISWSPDDKFILVKTGNDLNYLINLETNNSVLARDSEQVIENWKKDLKEIRNNLIERLELAENLKSIAVSEKSLWAPDDNKFLYTVQNGDNLEYKVFNMEKPLPVGEKEENLVFTSKVTDAQPKITWYDDSFHLILTELDPQNPKAGKVSLIRIDGSNKTEIYNNTLYSDTAYSSPGGDKIIILTTFKSGGTPNLYTIGIR